MAGQDKNFVLSKGRFYFEQFVETNGVYASAGKGEAYIAQTKEGKINVKSETLDHYDADEGLNVLDEQITTKVDVTGSLMTENITMDVISKFFLANGVTDTAITAASNLSETFTAVPGNYYQLGKSASLPQGARNVTAVTVELTSAPGSAIANANNANYEVDLVTGRLHIKSDSAVLTDGTSFVVKYSVSAGTRSIVVSKDQQIRGALRFVSANPVGGQRDFYMPLVNLSPDGDISLKGGTDWQGIGFKFTALKLNSATERLYVDGRAV